MKQIRFALTLMMSQPPLLRRMNPIPYITTMIPPRGKSASGIRRVSGHTTNTTL